MTPRRQKGEGSVYQCHDHPTCPPLNLDRTRPAHRCRGRWAAEVEDGYDRNGKRKRRVVTAATNAPVPGRLLPVRNGGSPRPSTPRGLAGGASRLYPLRATV